MQPVPQYRFSCGRGSEIEATIRLQKRNRRATSPSARLIELSKSVRRPHIEKVDPVRRISEVKTVLVDYSRHGWPDCPSGPWIRFLDYNLWFRQQNTLYHLIE